MTARKRKAKPAPPADEPTREQVTAALREVYRTAIAAQDQNEKLARDFERLTGRPQPQTPAEWQELAALIGLPLAEAAPLSPSEIRHAALGWYAQRKAALMRPDLPPLRDDAAEVFEFLRAQPAHKGWKTDEIINALASREKDPVFISTSSFTRAIKELREGGYGIENKPKVGYRIPESARF